MCQTPPVSMKGEITCSKRHLKGHKSKLSFSRFDDPRVTSRLFPHSIVLPRNARWANHQVINCSSAWPQIWRKIGKFLGSALISLVIRARFLKKPQTTSSVLSPSPGRKKPCWGKRLPNVNSHAKREAPVAALSCAGNGKQAFVSSLPLDVTWTSRPGISAGVPDGRVE